MKKFDFEKLVKSLKQIRISNNRKTELHEPSFFGNEINYLKKSIKNKEISTYGKYTNYFENEIKKITKSKYVVALNSGTEALHLSMKSCGISSSHEILVPALSYIAPVNAIVYCGADPHFIDLDPNTLGVDCKKLETYLLSITIKKKGKTFNKITKKQIKAIIVVHLFGQSSNIIEIKKICKKFNFKLIEDAAEAFGSYLNGKHLGTLGDIGCLSFNGNKIITTGGGGAVITNNRYLASKVYEMSTVCKKKSKFEFIHFDIGYNSRMPSLNAALGLAQIKNYKKIRKKKRLLYLKYKKIVSKFNGIKLFKENEFSQSNYWLQVMLLDKKNKKLKKKIIEEAHKQNFFVRPAWKLISQLKPYKKKQKMDLSGAKNLYDRIICLPSGNGVIF